MIAAPSPAQTPLAATAGHILVADDDARLRDLLKRFLESCGHRVTTAVDAEQTRRLLASVQPDLLILDVMMPSEDGFALTRSLNAQGPCGSAILLLSARGLPDDRVNGLEAGADDYLAKPFDPRELALRVQALLRRRAPAGTAEETARFGAYVYETVQGRLTREGADVPLTDSEHALLSALAGARGAAVPRETLARRLGLDGARAVDVRVARLRRKLFGAAGESAPLVTVRGVGYRLDLD